MLKSFIFLWVSLVAESSSCQCLSVEPWKSWTGVSHPVSQREHLCLGFCTGCWLRSTDLQSTTVPACPQCLHWPIYYHSKAGSEVAGNMHSTIPSFSRELLFGSAFRVSHWALVTSLFTVLAEYNWENGTEGVSCGEGQQNSEIISSCVQGSVSH